jgi:hypothetical protein
LASEVASAAKLQPTPTYATVMGYVTTMPNFVYPACKNAYTPNVAVSALVAGNAAANGAVGTVAAIQPDAAGDNRSVINVTFMHSKSGPANDGATFTLMSSVPCE